MSVLAYGFNAATYEIKKDDIEALKLESDISAMLGTNYAKSADFETALLEYVQAEEWENKRQDILNASIELNTILILGAILAFVASFAISIGPVMWVLFSELFPNRIRGIAISFVGLINSAVSFIVQWVFPWELEVLGSSTTFLIYGLFALAGLIFIVRVVPETKGKSLEELERTLVK
jgi:MFS family permease